MRKLLTTRLIGAVAALLILLGGPAAMAQKASTTRDRRRALQVRHRIFPKPRSATVSRAPIKFLPRKTWATRTIH